jgi:cellulose biosynthesis protein BcsQ
MIKRLDLILNGKGGVGKSFFAVNFVQYLKDKNVSYTACDCDNENSTLKRFHEEAEFLDLAQPRALDTMFRAIEKSDLVVVDCRAASTELFFDYFGEIDLRETLQTLSVALTLIMPVNHEADSVDQLQRIIKKLENACSFRTNLRRSHEDAEAFTGRLTNLLQDRAARQDTSGEKFSIELDGQVLDNRGIAGELIVRRAEKIKNRIGDDVRIGRFAGFDLFLRPTFNNNVEMIVRGRNSYSARVTDTALGTIRSLEANIQSFEERAARLETDIADANKRAKELETKVGAHFEREERYQQLSRRQSEIEEKLDLTKNQAPSQIDADAPDANEQKNSEKQTVSRRQVQRSGMRV